MGHFSGYCSIRASKRDSADSPAVVNIDQFRLSGNHITQIHKSITMASVFVCNIPYGVTEDQLKEIFGEAGSVVSFRIVHDRETGRSKGFGFCEYQDPSSAAAAMRDLNGYEINGRTLRVDSANRK